MKARWRAWAKRLWGEDLFRKTEIRLALQYSGILTVFLSVFIVIVYLLLRYIIMHDQERELRALADMEQISVQEHIRQNRKMDVRLMESQGILAGSEDQLFTYFIGPKGQLVYGKEAGKWQKNRLLGTFAEWVSDPTAIRKTTLEVAAGSQDGPRGPRRYKEPLASGESRQIRVLLTGRPILQNGNQVATIFVGTNISYHYELLDWLLLVLGGIALVFYLAALAVSYRMSKRAMLPVRLSFRRQQEFVADASHELRTPLSVLQSSLDALELEQTEETDPFVRKLLCTMKDEVKRMSRLTGDLLTLARSGSPEYSFRRERFDYEPLAKQVAESMGAVAEEKGVKLHYEASGPLEVTGDPERLQQLLYILLDNAVKYTPEGGRVQVRLSAGQGMGRALALSVADTGIGIAPEDQPRIFDRFYRADKARSRQSGGHGLGLSIARWIVEGHGGTVRVGSNPGEGAEFTVTLPI